MKEIIVDANIADKRLDSFLKAYLSNAPAGFIYKMLRKKNITVNDKRAEEKLRLKVGDSIKIFFSDDTLSKFMAHSHEKDEDVRLNAASETESLKSIKATIVYEDNNIILVSKPAGLLTQKASKNDYSLNDWLIDYLMSEGKTTRESLTLYKPSVCNRLDRNTSGLVICAKSLLGARVMNRMLKDRTIGKYYRTIVQGHLKDPMTLKGYLYKDTRKNKVTIKDSCPEKDSSSFSYIETEYVPLKYSEENSLTLIEVKLITGKPHQIRAHLSSIGHPVIGDLKYGGQKLFGLEHQLLHSYRLRFPSEMPEGFEALAGKEYFAKLPEIFEKLFGKE